jgi:hypothetical protein
MRAGGSRTEAASEVGIATTTVEHWSRGTPWFRVELQRIEAPRDAARLARRYGVDEAVVLAALTGPAAD